MKQKFFKILLGLLVLVGIFLTETLIHSYGIRFFVVTALRSWLLDIVAAVLAVLLLIAIARVTGLPFPRWLVALLILVILAVPFVASILRGEGLFPSPRVAAVYARELIGSVVVVLAFWITWRVLQPNNNTEGGKKCNTK